MPTPPFGQGQTILVVEDEEYIRSTVQQALDSFGYRTLLAENGAEAVALYAAQKNEIALVLTDMAMPVMDGLATIIALRKLDPQVRIIASSGHAAKGDVEKASLAGAVDFLPKPYTSEALRRIIAKNLHARP